MAGKERFELIVLIVESRVLRCVSRKDQVASLHTFVAGEAGFVHRLVGRLAVLELRESPAACRGVFSRVLDC